MSQESASVTRAACVSNAVTATNDQVTTAALTEAFPTTRLLGATTKSTAAALATSVLSRAQQGQKSTGSLAT